ncbi:MAG: hypothetical protein HEQ13_00340 [Dolichospermum sp. DEX189]|nr:hypothetical protein [Dolichospermum sp. DEX189]
MFGVITACYKGDYFLAKATCASVRFFMPDVPICVIVDGDLDIQELKDVYNVYELRIDSLEHIELRKLLAGSGKSKLAALVTVHRINSATGKNK